MAKGYALLVGLRHVDSAAYGYDKAKGCEGAEADVDRVSAILNLFIYEKVCLKTEAARADAILDWLKHFSEISQAGDIVVFYFAGHGEQVPDLDGDELDGRDETVLAYDRPIIDDEFDKIWLTYSPGVRIVMMSDSCHSGTNYKLAAGSAIDLSYAACCSSEIAQSMRASLIHFGAARDEAKAVGYLGGGAFTIALSEEYTQSFSGGYRDLYQSIRDSVSDQDPRFGTYGPVSEDFLNQKPFEI
jgi:metacaspase-1